MSLPMGLMKLLAMICLHAHVLIAQTADNEARILILGAGASGLQAARTLHDAGMDDFIIIEADDRIGGRVHSAPFAGITVNVGAQWAAPRGSQTDQIVRRLDLDRHTSDFDSLTIRNGTGHDVTDEADTNYEHLEKGIDKLDELSTVLLDNEKIPDMSQRTALRLGGWQPKSAIDKAIEWYQYDFEYGETPDVTSTKWSISSEELESMDYIKDQRGFVEIFKEVAGFLEAPEYVNHTRLNKKVASIDYTNDISVVVTCEDGTRFVGEYVLVTFSIGILQNDLVRFVPPLPEWKDVEIKKFKMVGYTNIYLSFPSKFWDDTEWILYASERRGYYPLFLNYQVDGLFPQSTPILLVTVTGDESRRVEEQSSTETKAEIQAVLRKMYGEGIPDATDILVSDWSHNPLTMGSFSDVPLGVPAECRNKLESRVGRVFFGGEATSKLLTGYVAGGLESGEREASKILGCMELGFAECPSFEFEGNGLECAYYSACSSQWDFAHLWSFGILTLFYQKFLK